jgi:phosphoribosylamine--glycine ligase
VPIAATDLDGLLQFARDRRIDLTAIGPEVPLVEGIVDRFQAQGLKVFGPTQAGAQLEGSKAWAKALMREAGVPTAASAVFTDAASAVDYLCSHPAPIVVKADGLAAGKGVTVARSVEEAIAAVEALFAGSLGTAGQTVVIEDFLPGQEASVLAFIDGQTLLPMVAAQDHKPIGAGDTGPNTGGMGAYAPTPVVSPHLMECIQTQVLEPTLAALQRRGIDYRGVLYAGLMISPAGEPSVVEFNCRFGDPETQVVLPLLESDLAEVMLACVDGRLQEIHLDWHPGYAACVVMAAAGYPSAYENGKAIAGLDDALAMGTHVFHAGTKQRSDGAIVTDGGRVLGVSAVGNTLPDTLQKAYAGVGKIAFEGATYRPDIGFRVLSRTADPSH